MTLVLHLNIHLKFFRKVVFSLFIVAHFTPQSERIVAMNEKIMEFIHQAITVDDDYIKNLLEIYKIMNGLKNGDLVVTKEKIKERNQK